MSSPDRYYHYQSLVSAGDGRKFAIASILFHFGLIVLMLTWGLWAPEGDTLKLGGGGGGGGQPMGIGLVSSLPAGPELFKPLAKAPEPAAAAVKAPPAPEPPARDEFVQTAKNAPKSKPAPASSAQPAAKETRPSPPGPIGTAETAPGVRSGTGPAGGGGEGSGHGVSIGSGGEGFYDSWYARQVEQRVSSNWLKSRMGIQFSGRQRVVIEFTVLPNGHIDDVTIKETTGADAFNRSALRAVQASDPLPPLPNQYRIQGNRIRFVAIFEYPTQ